MALDISDINLQAALQARIDALDSNSSMSDILALERAAATFGTTTYYDSAGELPNEPVLEGSIFATKGSNIYQNNALYLRGSSNWKELQSLNKPKPQYSGETAGFWAGGSSAPSPARTTISKVEFASDTVTGVHGTLSEGTYNATGTTSATDGYVVGGSFFPNPLAAQRFSKFSFASATPVSASPITPAHPSGQRNNTGVSDIAGGKGYLMNQDPSASNPATGVRWSHPFANDVPFTQETGNMNGSKEYGMGVSSITKGYHTGGAQAPQNPFPGGSSDIQSFPFASDVDAVAITATLVNALQQHSSASGTDEYAYIFAGQKGSPPPLSFNSDIERFPFASEDISVSTGGTLEPGTTNTAGVSGISSAYLYKGGYFQKFNYGATTSISTIADLSGTTAASRNNRATGHQF